MSVSLATLLLLLAAGTACERESRRFREPPAASPPPREAPAATARPAASRPSAGPYDDNAYGISEGQRLYTWFNCIGCHAHGGGGMGPPLMDAEWIYGGGSSQIFASIVEGRPNGMPAFGTRLTDQQVWQLVAFVRSLSARVPLDARPGRPDAMHVTDPATLREPTPPASGAAAAGEP